MKSQINIFISLFSCESSPAKNNVLFFIIRLMQILCLTTMEVNTASQL